MAPTFREVPRQQGIHRSFRRRVLYSIAPGGKSTSPGTSEILEIFHSRKRRHGSLVLLTHIEQKSLSHLPVMDM